MSSLRERLRSIVEPLPAGASVTLPVDVLQEWLDGEPGNTRQEEPLVDLTVSDVANLFDRSDRTIRLWIREEKLPGAYRLNGREWRIPREAIRGLRQTQATNGNTTAPSHRADSPRPAKRRSRLDGYKERR